MGLIDRFVVAVAADEADDHGVRVPVEQPHELGADIAGRPDDRDPDRSDRRAVGHPKAAIHRGRHRSAPGALTGANVCLSQEDRRAGEWGPRRIVAMGA